MARGPREIRGFRDPLLTLPASFPSGFVPPRDPHHLPALRRQRLSLEPAPARALLPVYFKLQAALADDDLDNSKAALRAMMEVTGHTGPLPDLLHGLLGAEKLDTLRRPAFEQISDALIVALKKEPSALEGTVIRMNCPMVYDDRGADWLQATDDLRNPYFGSAMLTCGEIVERLK